MAVIPGWGSKSKNELAHVHSPSSSLSSNMQQRRQQPRPISTKQRGSGPAIDNYRPDLTYRTGNVARREAEKSHFHTAERDNTREKVAPRESERERDAFSRKRIR